MAYFNQEKKAKIAPAIKALCKKYKVKASLAVRNNSTVVLNIKSGAIDFIDNANQTCGNSPYQVANGFRPVKNYIDVNPYHYGNHFHGVALEFITQAMEILNTDNYDNSRIEYDYFDKGHYVDVNIGRWNKPYELVK